MDERSEQPDSKLKVAGIEARTAVIVALVGALASFGTVVATKVIDSDRLTRAEWERSAPKQHWLRIRGIDGPPETKLRIVARVDGLSFAYPTETAWVELGGRLTEGLFPLPLKQPPYRISFSAEARSPQTRIYLSQNVAAVDASPEERLYRLLPVAMDDAGWSGGSTRGIDVEDFIEIRYFVTSE